MQRIAIILSVAGASGAAFADVVTQWNFNSSANSTITGGLTTPSASTGSGSASLVGGVTLQSGTLQSGTASGGSSDPVVTTPANYAWGTTNFPAASASNETAGVQFLASTAGYQDITISWDQRHSNSASRFWAFYYTIDGLAWTRLAVDGTNAFAGATPALGNPANTAGLFGPGGTFAAFDGTVAGAGDDWFNGRGVNLSSIVGANDNANFGFRIVASFDNGSGYASSSGAAYAASGTARFDMVTINGTLIPTPGAAALVALGGASLLRRRRHV